MHDRLVYLDNERSPGSRGHIRFKDATLTVKLFGSGISEVDIKSPVQGGRVYHIRGDTADIEANWVPRLRLLIPSRV